MIPALARRCFSLAALLLLALVIGFAPLGAAASSYMEKIDYTLTNQSNGDFHGQALEGSSFAGAQARGADFSGAQLQGAILTQAAFTGANFRGANLSDALMDRADFAGSDLRDALLNGVIANGSSFADAQIEGADFSEALLDLGDQRQLCRRATGINPSSGIATRDSLGCA